MNKSDNFGCFLVIFLILLLPSTSLPDDAEVNFTSLKYGIIAKSNSNPDSLFIVEDNTTLHTGDRIKINIESSADSYVYIVFKLSNDEYYLLYDISRKSNYLNEGYNFTSLDWLELDDNIGTETIYFIASVTPLNKLKDLLKKHSRAKSKLKMKFGNQISDEIASLSQSEGSNIPTLNTRLSKPESIGGVFRGNHNNDNSKIENVLTNVCKGNSVASDVVKIIHK